MKQGTEVSSFCRQCGGDRKHSILATTTKYWSDEETPVNGKDIWSILECRGCETVTKVHEHSFSEDIVMTEDGPVPIVQRDLYPPSPKRKKPEWGFDLFLSLTVSEQWINYLYDDVYSALGMRHHALAAMGARAIVDYIVTSRAGDKGSFKDKLVCMKDKGLIQETLVDVIYAAFDAGSAAAHRGYRPEQKEVFALLDITENLMQIVLINPIRHKKQLKAAARLQSTTPAWKKD